MALVVADEALPLLRPGTVYADLTASEPKVMAELAERFEARGVSFVDVAIVGPVPWYGAQVPLLASGSGRDVIANLARRLGAPIEVLDAPAGAAMAHKLLRSIVMKGLASIIWEAVEAGSAAGYETWIRDQIAAQLAGDGHAVIERLLTGTVTHAERRQHEMESVVEYLTSLGVPAVMSKATAALHSQVAQTAGVR